MPNPAAFLGAFHLTKKSVFGDRYMIIHSTIKHIVKQRYAEYEFPITLEVQCPKQTTVEQVRAAFALYVDIPRIVHSQYNNPYRCTIEIIKITPRRALMDHHNYFVIQCLGKGSRIFASK